MLEMNARQLVETIKYIHIKNLEPIFQQFFFSFYRLVQTQFILENSTSNTLLVRMHINY